MTITMCLLIFDALAEKLNNMETVIAREGVMEIMQGLAKDSIC